MPLSRLPTAAGRLSNSKQKTKEAVSKVTDTASFLGYYSNVALMEGFYAAIL